MSKKYTLDYKDKYIKEQQLIPSSQKDNLPIDRTILEQTLEYLYKLSVINHWKRGGLDNHQKEMDDLDMLIGKIQKIIKVNDY